MGLGVGEEIAVDLPRLGEACGADVPILAVDAGEAQSVQWLAALASLACGAGSGLYLFLVQERAAVGGGSVPAEPLAAARLLVGSVVRILAADHVGASRAALDHRTALGAELAVEFFVLFVLLQLP